jgi:hypothetical protein
MATEHEREHGLGWLPRIAAGAVGAVGLCGGGVAVFATTNEAGSVALLIVGGAFTYLALSGQVFHRLKFGDNEAEFSRRVVAGVIRSIEDADESNGGKSRAETAAEILEKAIYEAPTAPRRAVVAMDGFRYEQAVMGALRRVASDVQVESGPVDSGIDAIVGGSVAIILKYRANLTGPRPLLHMTNDIAEPILGSDGNTVGPNALLVITNAEVPKWIEDGRVTDYTDRVKVVTWRPGMGEETLAHALAELS